MPPHCDSMDGAVVKAVQKALDAGRVEFVLPYVHKAGEEEVKKAFEGERRRRRRWTLILCRMFMNAEGNLNTTKHRGGREDDQRDCIYGLSGERHGSGPGIYEGVLGLHKTHDTQGEWLEYEIGSGTFALTTIEMGHPPGSKGAVVAFEVDDLDGFVKRLKEKAVSFAVEIFETPVCRMAVIEDPDGNQITIHKRK